jgi:dienelactone hydrolase
MNPKLPAIIIGILIVSNASAATAPPDPQPVAPASQPALTPEQRWQSIQPFFSPPEQYVRQMGQLPSVMKFDDGTPVTLPQDWPRRRREIRAFWDAKLGAWPALLDKPSVEYLSQEHVENFTRHKIRIELAAGVKRNGYLLIPDGDGKFPAVACVYYDAETSANLNPKNTISTFGYDLAKRGFATLCLGGPGDDVRKPTVTPMQPLMYLAYVAANAHTALTQMPQVDANRIGIIGHSFGGKWAMFASCLYDKFAAAVWSDPGIVFNEADSNANYWEPWYLGYEKGVQRKPGLLSDADPRTGPYKELIAEHHDLNELHALMAPRPFLVSGGAQDPLSHWPVLNTDIALYKFLGYDDRIALTHRDGHRPTPESKEQAYQFLEHFLKDDPAPPSGGK